MAITKVTHDQTNVYMIENFISG